MHVSESSQSETRNTIELTLLLAQLSSLPSSHAPLSLPHSALSKCNPFCVANQRAAETQSAQIKYASNVIELRVSMAYPYGAYTMHLHGANLEATLAVISLPTERINK